MEDLKKARKEAQGSILKTGGAAVMESKPTLNHNESNIMSPRASCMSPTAKTATKAEMNESGAIKWLSKADSGEKSP